MTEYQITQWRRLTDLHSAGEWDTLAMVLETLAAGSSADIELVLRWREAHPQ
jgi:hypothetical protein